IDNVSAAWKIMTGAPVPNGFDSIIPVENTELVETSPKQTVKCFSSPKLGAHIRCSGEDFLKGEIVLGKNIVLNANRIMALASLGVSKVDVKKKPTIAVFSTGKELVDNLEQPLNPGQIYNSNMPYILDYLKELPVHALNAGTNYDQADLYEQALQKELDSGVHLIISTGAVSMGDFDFIPQTILKMNAKIIFHKSKIRPGKPILFAVFPNGTYYFGLPGNPISAAIGLRFFVTHLINIMLELPLEKPLQAKLTNTKNKKKGFQTILKANVHSNSEAIVSADIMQGQESFKINSLIDSNAWVVLGEELETIEQDTIVDYYPSTLDLR
ncbi:MAG: molybdopterin molybdotransferase MoeA, partial [Kangiellaceae bacterium]|nr:molybdopterin molybdotransferase MoeA [Kangiellaceae bacterium]